MTDKYTLGPCFFILGYGRSGTTLFRRMISAHPSLSVAPESDIFQRLPPHMGEVISNRDAFEKVMAACPPYYAEVYDLDAFGTEAVEALPLTRADFFALLIQKARIAAPKAGAIWGHKMPSEWPYIRTWRDWYPNARFLHMMRHPQDAIASMVQYQLQRYPTTALVGAWQWRKAYDAIRRDAGSLGPDRYLLVRYEDLVSAPEGPLRATCALLGVDAGHVPDMIDYKSDASAAHVDDGEHMQQTHGDLTAARVGRSRETFSDGQMAVIDYILRDAMAELEYEPRAEAALPAWKKLWIGAACAGLNLAWAGVRALRRARGQL